jgi:hypothetical protein
MESVAKATAVDNDVLIVPKKADVPPEKEKVHLTPQKSSSHCRYLYESGEQCLMGDEIEYSGAIYTVLAGRGGSPKNPSIKLKEIRTTPCIKSVKFIKRGQGSPVPVEDASSEENQKGKEEMSVDVLFPSKNERAPLQVALSARTRDLARVETWVALLHEWEIASVQELKEVEDEDFRAMLNHADFSKKTNLKAALRHLRTH